MTSTLISPDSTWLLWTVILGGVALCIYLEQNFRWAARLSGPVLGLLMAMMLATTRVMPGESPAYAFVDDFLVPLAIPLLLFKADIMRIIRVTGKMFVAFHVSVLGTVFGAMAATLIMQSQVDHAPEVGGIMTASYSGGTVNFMAVKSTFPEVGDITNSLLVADNFIMAAFFILLLVLSNNLLLQRLFPTPVIDDQRGKEGDATNAAAEHWAPKPIGLLDIAAALAVACAIAMAAITIAGGLKGQPIDETLFGLPGNKFVWITIVSLATATLFRRQLDRVNGAMELGSYALYIYLFSIGLPANLYEVISDVPAMFGYCAIMAIVNLVVTLGLGKVLRLNLEDLLLCVNATLGGPPSAVAMAVSKGWPKLILPAMLVGIWGYVIGTTVGVLTARLLTEMVGGTS